MFRKNKKQNSMRNDQSGFTLVELLVSITIFAVAAIILTGIYVAFSQVQLRTNASQELLNNSQYVMEIMAREIRNGELFYYDPALCETKLGYDSCIVIARESGEFAGFVLQNKVLKYGLFTCSGDTCSTDSTTDLLGANLNNVDVEALDFYIQPDTNPFPSITVNEQPRITIKLETSFPSTRDIEQVSYTLQTTVSSRIYKR